VDIILSASRRISAGDDAGTSEVLLHVYYLGTESPRCDCVAVLRALGAVFGGRHRTGCGVYHTAIEVAPLTNGLEWSYGHAQAGSGVYSAAARASRWHEYRETVSLGRTQVLSTELDELLERLGGDWAGAEYHLVRHNCQSFCTVLIDALNVKPLPRWVCRSTDIGRAWLQGSQRLASAGRRAARPCQRRKPASDAAASGSTSTSRPSTSATSISTSPIMLEGPVAGLPVKPTSELDQLSLAGGLPALQAHKLEMAAASRDAGRGTPGIGRGRWFHGALRFWRLDKPAA